MQRKFYDRWWQDYQHHLFLHLFINKFVFWGNTVLEITFIWVGKKKPCLHLLGPLLQETFLFGLTGFLTLRNNSILKEGQLIPPLILVGNKIVCLNQIFLSRRFLLLEGAVAVSFLLLGSYRQHCVCKAAIPIVIPQVCVQMGQKSHFHWTESPQVLVSLYWLFGIGAV